MRFVHQSAVSTCLRHAVSAFLLTVAGLCGTPDVLCAAGIVNGDFESNDFTSNPDGWTANSIFVTTDVINAMTGAYLTNGTNFALFESAGLPEAPLTSQTLSQTVVADQTYLAFDWSRLVTTYVSDGGATLQVASQDMTAAGPLLTHDIDFAPSGSDPSGVRPWIHATIPGFTTGHTYFIEFRAGISTTATPSNTLIRLLYAVDDVAFVPTPEPSTAILAAIGCLGLALGARRRPLRLAGRVRDS